MAPFWRLEFLCSSYFVAESVHPCLQPCPVDIASLGISLSELQGVEMKFARRSGRALYQKKSTPYTRWFGDCLGSGVPVGNSTPVFELVVGW